MDNNYFAIVETNIEGFLVDQLWYLPINRRYRQYNRERAFSTLDHPDVKQIVYVEGIMRPPEQAQLHEDFFEGRVGIEGFDAVYSVDEARPILQKMLDQSA